MLLCLILKNINLIIDPFTLTAVVLAYIRLLIPKLIIFFIITYNVKRMYTYEVIVIYIKC
jgi:hypothetical protein